MGKINITIASRYEDDRNAISALLAEQDDFKILSVVETQYPHCWLSRTTSKY